MKKFKLEIEVEDDWEPMDCENCPLGYMESIEDEDDGYDYWYTCCLGGHYGHCYLVELGEEK